MSAETTNEAARSLSRAGAMLHEVASAEATGAEFTELRAQASRSPCDWFRVADLERAMGRPSEAEQAERRAARDRAQCR